MKRTDKKGFYLFQFLEAFLQLEDNTEPQEFGESEWAIDIYNQYDKADNVDEEFFFEVMLGNLSDRKQPLAFHSLNTGEINDDLNTIKHHAECLESCNLIDLDEFIKN